jgi:8-oxo-dGTP pyrophosphatase MutT (NUDIX family)
MIKTEFMTLYEELSEIQEAKTSRPFPQGYVEAAESINLGDCRMIASDVMDMRGELEESACLDYKGVLTRVAASVLPFRDGPEGKEIFLKLWRSAVYLLGGGVDISKDGTDPAKTVARESFEECNMTLSNIKDSGCSYWEYSEKPWVERHVANPEDRWNGYYTWLFTADYTGEGDNEFPEEGDNFRWYKVSDILARPDTKKLKFIKQAIIQGGYAEAPALEEDITLTEGKQLGYVSYAVREPRGKSTLDSLASILNSGVIIASTEEDGSRYVSTSRDLLSHLGDTWRCAVILDGDKLSNRYKFNSINANSQVYFNAESSNKALILKNIRKYQAKDKKTKEFIPNAFLYVVDMQGSSFLNTVPENVYEVIRTIMKAYNAEEAVKPDGKAKDIYKNRTNRDVKQFYHVKGQEKIKTANDWLNQVVDNTEGEPDPWVYGQADDIETSGTIPPYMAIGTKMQSHRVPKGYTQYDWICVEALGYNTKRPTALRLMTSALDKYKELVISHHGIDISSHDFFKQLGGSYADEAEERAVPQIIKLINAYGVEEKLDTPLVGLDITNCIRAIVVDERHTVAFTVDIEELSSPNSKPMRLSKDGSLIAQYEDPKNYRAIRSIREWSDRHNVPIVLYDSYTTNRDIIEAVHNGSKGVYNGRKIN